MEDKNAIFVFTDGSSLGNPGKGGWGAVLVWDDNVKELGGAELYTTNNRMEITAAIHAIRTIPATERKIVVHSDSSYVINGITKWVFGWKKNNWITSQKEEVLNKDLWEWLSKAVEGKKIEWKYVGGHVGVRGNERCDEIAVSFARGKPERLFNGKFSEYPNQDILDIGHDAEKKAGRSASREHSKAKAYSYLSLVDGKLEKHATWAECEARVKGKKAKFKKSVSKEDEERIMKEWSAER